MSNLKKITKNAKHIQTEATMSRATNAEVKKATQHGIKRYKNALRELARR